VTKRTEYAHLLQTVDKYKFAAGVFQRRIYRLFIPIVEMVPFFNSERWDEHTSRAGTQSLCHCSPRFTGMREEGGTGPLLDGYNNVAAGRVLSWCHSLQSYLSHLVHEE
jgi:hypothetical protein